MSQLLLLLLLCLVQMVGQPLPLMQLLVQLVAQE
jgi:hypothetical protein